LGLLREEKALTRRFLGSYEALQSIRKQIEQDTTVQQATSTSVDLPLSNESKRVLAYGTEEAERLGTSTSDPSICCWGCCERRNVSLHNCCRNGVFAWNQPESN
jgi:hypothetical protein